MVPVLTRRGLCSPYRRSSLPDGRTAQRKRVKPRHELITPPGVAVDEEVLRDAERAGDAGIVVERVRTGEVLWAPLPRWWRGFRINRRFGPQRVLQWQDLKPLPTSETQLLLFPAAVVTP